MGFHCVFITAIVVCSTSIIAQNFGELLVLRHSPTTGGSTEELTCISDDDDSAFIWNNAPKDFRPANPKRHKVSECAIWDSSRCHASWGDMSDWKVVESAIKPMAPVFDFRWEDFEEYTSNIVIDYSKYQYLGKVNQSSGNAVFSVRGKENVHVLLCEKEDQTEGPCFWIIIGGWVGAISVMRYCPNGAPADGKSPRQGTCKQIDLYNVSRPILDADEWRTFRLTWKSDEKRIALIADFGHEEKTIMDGHVESWSNVSHISVRLDQTSRVRFHFYEYLLTEKSGSLLYTEKFNFSEEEFCVELLVGLCPKCKLYVYLVDKSDRTFPIGNISGDEKSVYNGTLTWQSIKLRENITINGQAFGKSSKLKIEATLTGGEGEGRWAMDNFRMCKPAGQRRKSTISSYQIMPDIRCQKLSYNGSTIINPWSLNKIPSNTTESRKFIDKLIESCGSSCESFGKDSLLCNSTGCTCNRGYSGSNCNQTCSNGYHGYNCEEICTPCIIGPCNKTTGLCAPSCEPNTQLPPDCKKEIGKPNVKNITDTTATVYQNIEFEADVITSVDVVFQVKSSGSCMNFTASLKVAGTPSYYESYLSNLTLDTIYTVHTFVSVKLADDTISVTSPETNFTTTCFTLLEFIITPGKKELNVSSKTDRTCVNNIDPDYSVRILRLADNKTEWKHDRAEFPALYDNLTSYTEYRVIISDMRTNTVLFEKEVYTLESAPSGVQNLKAIFPTKNEITLQWDPPLKKNGWIRNYNISLTGKLIACMGSVAGDTEQILISQPDNKTTLKIPGLRPYASYTASVIAYTSESGKPETITFNTSDTLIPTSKFSNFSLSNDNLTLNWDQPSDCTTITGSTEYAALIFESIDLVVKYEEKKQTKKTSFNIAKVLKLTPYTMYRVHLYVIRNYDESYNSTNYQELTWRTPATSPPQVKDLKVYEADIDTNTISLEWIPPNPAYGEIESYQVTITRGKTAFPSQKFKVSEERLKCELRENHVCLKNFKIPGITGYDTYIIKICAINRGIKEPGNVTNFRITSEIYNKKPKEPNNLTSISQSHGIMMLNWERQMFSPTKIKEFYIEVHQTRTKLKTNETKNFNMSHPAETDRMKYSVDLHLLTSTDYVVSIVAVNRRNITSKESNISISVPGSVAYANGADVPVKQIGSYIEVQAPAVVNATDNTTVKVFVRGPTTCTETNSSEPTKPMKMKNWLAAVYKVKDDKPRTLTIGGIHNRGVPFNCSFETEGLYCVTIIAVDGYSNSTTANLTSVVITLKVIEPQKSNLAWLVIFPILAICTALIFVVYRKKRGLFKQANNMHSSTDQSIALWDQSEPPSPSLDMKDDLVTNAKSAPDVVPYNPHSYPVEIHKFEEYTKEELASGLLKSQYEKFTRGLTRPCDYGRLPANKTKNRYNDLIAYDDARVLLKKIPGDPHSDYINASYIQGYRKNKAYIATQGPKPNTVNDFWRMIWQEKVRVICMLANVVEGGKRKCEQYWPDVGNEAKYGAILVTNMDRQIFVDYTFRTFTLVHQKQIRQVTHLHYTGWPDHGVPMYTQSLVPYLKKLLEIDSGDGPIVVHCSAGVGRTGTIILCDTCLRSAREEKVVDLPAVTLRMRQRRANMVDNAQQYLLAHLVIVECVVSEQTQIPCDSLLQERIETLKKQLPSHIQRLKDTVWQDRALHSFAAPTFLGTEALTTNGIDELPPVFDPSPPFDSQSKYMTTVGVDGVKMKTQYLASRLPSPANISDLWRLIAQENVELVIMLQRPDPDDPTYCDIIPSELNIVPVSHMEGGSELLIEEDDSFTIDKYVFNRKGGEPQPLTVLTCSDWGYGAEGKPPPADALVSLWRASEKISRQEGPTFVLCHDGVTGCGLYLALSFLLERMSVAGECDVISAVRAVRRFKPDFVQSLEQFEYLYDAAVRYGECFETYANFS